MLASALGLSEHPEEVVISLINIFGSLTASKISS